MEGETFDGAGRLGRATGVLATLTDRAIPRAAYASDDTRVVSEPSIGCTCVLRGWGCITGGTACLYVLHTPGYHRLATLLSLPVPLVSQGEVQTSRQASTLVRTLAFTRE
jgi:hypothetical protein